MTTMDVWIEFGSTYSHVAVHRIEALASAGGVPIRYRPFLLGPIFKGEGWNDSPFNLYRAKGAYMWRDMERLCERDGIAFRRPSQFPRNGLSPTRVAVAAADEPWLPAFIRAVFAANFAEDRDISEPACVRELLVRAGCEQPDVWLARAGEPAVKDALRSATEEAARRGIFGAPSFTVGDELFWGQDRIEDALAWARRA